ncbi:conserved hypothetical protein [Tenacibaculum maritimum]|uniref:hypothetical protein n=1 Tax=Tenacibaculum maritimum TaxID=107401 RepID=UPI0012E412BF|nr:hypothetical protein [Tenacibaculum maritimum]CAA0145833.1 conserved hypothetical protein [Tenacibaculum maritimum]CAA0159606.1 conserved hypothetical protein [Tenacibaculum maritimum]
MSKELELLQWKILKNCDELRNIDSNKINIISDFSFEDHIELKDKDRGCRIYPYHFSSEIPKYEFEWDDCPLFKMSSNDIKRQVEIIKSWVLNKTLPSKIQTQFPEIKLNKLAEYYEKGEGIKGEFLESWDVLENSCIQGLSIEYYEQAKDELKLVQEMRKFKLDESLRIGSQLSVLILSRAKRQGIDEDEPQIRIVFLGDNKMKIYPNLNNNRKSIESEVKYRGYLEEMIKELLKEEIK